MIIDVDEYAQTLESDGIVIVPDFLDADKCDDIFEKIKQYVENADDEEDHGDVIIHRRGSQGIDEGMIDVDNIDYAVSGITDIIEDRSINDIINNAASEEYSNHKINTYWNKSVTNTRGFHADTYTGKYKCFIYLTDVPDKSYGPYTYVKGSHEPSKVQKIGKYAVNKLRRNRLTDAVNVDQSNIVHCTAEKGTLIISNQSGYHRGYPQQEGRERMLLATHFTPKNN